jgi:hypothetical protein
VGDEGGPSPPVGGFLVSEGSGSHNKVLYLEIIFSTAVSS